MNPFAFVKRSKLKRLRQAWDLAKEEVKKAEQRRDTRRYHQAIQDCAACCRAVMVAERRR